MSKSLFIGIDPGYAKACSVACGQPGSAEIRLMRTAKVLPKKKIEQAGGDVFDIRMRNLYVSYLDVLDLLHGVYKFDSLSVCIEVTNMNRFGNTAACLGMTSGVLLGASVAYGVHTKIPVKTHMVVPTSWRKTALGHGGLKKPEVPVKIKELYPSLIYRHDDDLSDDDWDAIGICLYNLISNKKS